jgi:Tfp pilus assembly protein PilN
MEQQVNLYQPILGAEKRLFSARAIGVGLVLLGLCLCGLAAFGSWRTSRVERSIALLATQQATELARVERTSAALAPGRSLAELDTQAKSLSADIAARERALDLVRLGTASPATGFAARLEALARRQLDGLWLQSIVVGSGDGRLAFAGSAVDSKLIPAYLAALAEEHALAGVRFDKLTIRRANHEEAPAQLVFELGAPGLKFPSARAHAAAEAHP